MADVLSGQMPDAFDSLLAELNKLQADLATLRTQFNSHVHGGITVGAANSGAPTANAPALTSAPMTRKRSG